MAPDGCKKGKKAVQKVVIPKGMINPLETTIIEIPANLQQQPVVIAKKFLDTSFSSANTSFAERKNTIRSKTKVNVPSSSYFNEFPQLDNNSISAVSEDQDFSNLNETEVKEQMIIQKGLEDFQKARRRFLKDASTLTRSNYATNYQANFDQPRVAQPRPYIDDYKFNRPNKPESAAPSDFGNSSFRQNFPNQQSSFLDMTTNTQTGPPSSSNVKAIMSSSNQVNKSSATDQYEWDLVDECVCGNPSSKSIKYTTTRKSCYRR